MTYEIKYYEQIRGDGTVYYFAKVIFTERVKVLGLFWWNKRKTLYAELRYGGSVLETYVNLISSSRMADRFEDFKDLKQKTEKAANDYISEKERNRIVSYKPIN